jgi:glutamyl-tRNA synthetase
VHVSDLIRGAVTFENSQLDDLIIQRSDGTPTYNLVVVVDDVDMGITHVVRGDDHLNNTPKQLHIYEALGSPVPRFAHLPMILGPDKARLSKRHGATSVTAYRDEGYLPEALVNYLVRLGWSHGDQEIFSRDELVEYFSFESVGKSAAVFNPEKLLWLNAQYIKKESPERLVDLVLPVLVRQGIVCEGAEPDRTWLASAVGTLVERAKTLVELASSLSYYIFDEVEIEPKAREKFINGKFLENLKAANDALRTVEPFQKEQLESAFREVTERLGVKLGKVAQPLRAALTGRTESPGIFDVLEVLGREKAVRRVEKAIRDIKDMESA